VCEEIRVRAGDKEYRFTIHKISRHELVELEARDRLSFEVDLGGVISNLEDGVEGVYNLLDVLREVSLAPNRVELRGQRLRVEADLKNVHAHVRGFDARHSDLAWDEHVHIFWGRLSEQYWRITQEECPDGEAFVYIDYYEDLELLKRALRSEYGPEVAEEVAELARRLRGPEEAGGARRDDR